MALRPGFPDARACFLFVSVGIWVWSVVLTRILVMDIAGDSGTAGLDAVLCDVAVLAAAALGNALELLEVVSRIEGLCDRLAGVRMGVLRDAEVVGEPGLGVAERLHATNRVSGPSSRADVRVARDLADRFPVVGPAWRDGTVSASQARGIVTGLRQLPLALSAVKGLSGGGCCVGPAVPAPLRRRRGRWQPDLLQQ